jgi:hypothetical protein
VQMLKLSVYWLMARRALLFLLLERCIELFSKALYIIFITLLLCFVGKCSANNSGYSSQS